MHKKDKGKHKNFIYSVLDDHFSTLSTTENNSHPQVMLNYITF